MLRDKEKIKFSPQEALLANDGLNMSDEPNPRAFTIKLNLAIDVYKMNSNQFLKKRYPHLFAVNNDNEQDTAATISRRLLAEMVMTKYHSEQYCQPVLELPYDEVIWSILSKAIDAGKEISNHWNGTPEIKAVRRTSRARHLTLVR
jgi:hypothetical protein